MQQDFSLTIECKSAEQVTYILSNSGINEIKILTIERKINKKIWLSFGEIEWELGKKVVFPNVSIKDPIDSLNPIMNMPNLYSLNLSFLGLKKNPHGVSSLHSLKNLDLSFNYISIYEIQDFLELNPNLTNLYIFGIRVSDREIEEIKQVNSSIRIHFSNKALMDYFNQND